MEHAEDAGTGVYDPSDVTRRAPVTGPQKEVCVGLNYRDHAEEGDNPIPDEPVLFSKFPTTVTGPESAISWDPAYAEDVDYEAALFESDNFGRTFERVSYPGEPHEIIETWAIYDGDIICGSRSFDIPDQRDDVEGRLMRRDDDGEYYTVGRVDANIGRIEPVS